MSCLIVLTRWVPLLALCLALGLGAFGQDYPSVYEQMDYRLHLGGKTFDPLREAGTTSGWRAPENNHFDLGLVQYHAKADQADLNKLVEHGVTPVAYIYPYTYLVWSLPKNRQRLSSQAAVRWQGRFETGFRLLPSFRNLGNEDRVVRGLVYAGAKKALVTRALQESGAREIEWLRVSSTFNLVGFRSEGKNLAEIARIPGVITVQLKPSDGGTRGEMSAQLLTNSLDMTGTIQAGYLNWLNSQGLSGQGVVVAIVDDGIQTKLPDLAGREVTCIGGSCSGVFMADHGTHVAGVALGSGASGVLDAGGFLKGLGYAPAASYVDLLEGNHQSVGGVLRLMTHSVRSGAIISNNSWGISSQALGYDVDTMTIDMGIRDADPDMPGNQPISYVLAIDNGNGQLQSQGTPDDAKNIIAVGATQLQTTLGGQGPNMNDLASVTAHGPARDGRLLPHLVAPGCRVDGPIINGMFSYRCGTSFAAPAVTGSAALFIEAYRNLSAARGASSDPSPALVKAALLASGKDLAGNRDAIGLTLGHRPDAKQGWGRPQLNLLVEAMPQSLYYDTPVVFDSSGEVWQVPLEVIDSLKPVTLALVWTDAPGAGLGGVTPAWCNDLDLRVEYDGQSYFGNQVGSNGWSQAGGLADFRNNSEGVWLGPNANGEVNVEVWANHIAWDGLPQQGDLTDQDFSLVAINLKERDTFRVQAEQSQTGLCKPGQTSIEVTLKGFGEFSEAINLSVNGLPMGISAQFSTNNVTPPASVQVSFTADATVVPGQYALQLVGVAGSESDQTDVGLFVYDSLPGELQNLMPSNTVNNVPLQPGFNWNPQVQAAYYELQLAKDVNFTQSVLTVETVSSSVSVQHSLESLTRYYWRVRAHNACGTGIWSATHRFRTRWIPPILLVDDDGNAPDVRSLFGESLHRLGYAFDVWDTQNSTNEPVAEILNRYQLVIWFSGAATNFSDPKAGPNEQSEEALGQFLDQGGCLLISAQDYLYDRGGPSHNVPNQFMRQYLGVDSGISDVSQSTVSGNGALFSGINSSLNHAGFPNQSDRLSPNSSALLAFSGDMGDAGVVHETADYKAYYFAFSLAQTSELARDQIIEAVVSACPVTFPSECVGMGDLLDRATGWPESTNLLELLSCFTKFAGKQ